MSPPCPGRCALTHSVFKFLCINSPRLPASLRLLGLVGALFAALMLCFACPVSAIGADRSHDAAASTVTNSAVGGDSLSEVAPEDDHFPDRDPVCERLDQPQAALVPTQLEFGADPTEAVVRGALPSYSSTPPRLQGRAFTPVWGREALTRLCRWRL